MLLSPHTFQIPKSCRWLSQLRPHCPSPYCQVVRQQGYLPSCCCSWLSRSAKLPCGRVVRVIARFGFGCRYNEFDLVVDFEFGCGLILVVWARRVAAWCKGGYGPSLLEQRIFLLVVKTKFRFLSTNYQTQ